MPRLLRAGLLAVLLPLLTAALLRADEAEDAKLLNAAGVKADGPGLLEFFRKHTLADAERDKILKLIDKLGADEFDAREKAAADLAAVGPTAGALLRQAIARPDQDIEIVRSGERLLKKIEPQPGNLVASAAARAAARAKPDGLAEVLLAYFPFADDSRVLEDVEEALAAVAYKKDEPNKVLEAALDDKDPERRAAVAEALLKGGPKPHAGAKKLLADADPQVRLRVALALTRRKDRDAFPVLVELLAELPKEQAWRAEEPLAALAGDAAPQAPSELTDEARKKYRDAWDAWYKKDGVKADLARLDGPTLEGYTLSVAIDQQFVNGSVTEYGKDGKVRWQVKGLMFPLDAQVLAGGERILVCEFNGQRVTERTTANGEVKWERRFNQPFACRRLANGNTFVASQNQIVEIDREGKDVFTYNRPTYDIMSAARTRGGEFVFLTNLGTLSRVDRSAKVVQSVNVGPPGTWVGIDALPNGNVLVPQMNQNKVVEYDRDGKVVWEAEAAQPTSAQRLPDGHTLVASLNNGTLVELDAKGKKVSEQKAEGRPWRASRR